MENGPKRRRRKDAAAAAAESGIKLSFGGLTASAKMTARIKGRSSHNNQPLYLLMTLKSQITEDMKSAMRAKEAERLATIRLLLAAIKQKEVDEQIELDDAAVVGVLDKLVKQRKDSIEAFEKADRQDLADKEKAEMAVLSAYLPERMSAEEVAAEIKAIVAEVGASSMADMGKVMAAAKTRLAGKAEMGQVSAAVKASLAG